VRRRWIVLACVVSAGIGFGAALFAGPRTGLTHDRSPRPVVFFRVRTNEKVVGMTFDDGPDPRWTPRVLELLAQHRARATFFLVGKSVLEHPDLVHAELSGGNEVADHTWDHPDLELLSPAQVNDEIERGADALRQVGAPSPKYFRPPKGFTDEAVGVIANAHRYRTVFWELCLERFVDHTDVGGGVEAMLARVRPGAILLAHDGGIPNRGRTLQALPILLQGLRDRGYKIVDITQLLKARQSS
jgi:peptidoglycan/xylan/chitin deacetylase (PgdA/CDA1 family)